MEYTNETLAQLLVETDASTDSWVFNRYCSFCGKFLYPEERAVCKKCKTPVKNALKRPIPFLTSASAIEKLIVWLRGWDPKVAANAADIISRWIASDRSSATYKIEIVISCVNILCEHKQHHP